MKLCVSIIKHYGVKNHGESDLQFFDAFEGPKGAGTKRHCGASL